MNHRPPLSDLCTSLSSEAKKLGEYNDCTVRTLALSCDLDYMVAHEIMRRKGRKHGKGVSMHVLLSAIKEQGKKIDDVTKLLPSVRTVRAFQVKGYKHCYVIAVKGHVLCMKDGIVHDWTNGRLHRIEEIYRISIPF